MSLILEALRKSEAERQRGRAPGLFVEQRAVRGRERAVPAWAWGLVALLVIVLVAWGWREAQRPVVVTAPAPPLDTVVEAAPSGIAERMDAAPAADDTLAPMILAPGSAVTPPVVAPAAEPRAEAALGGAAPVAQVRPEAMSEAVAAAGSARSEADPPPPREAPALAVAGSNTNPLDLVPAAPRASAAAAAPPAMTAAPPADAADGLPGLGALPAADRATLPPLKLTMHVFAQDPAQRFVILDGQRLAEGASPATGVVLEEIRRDGLVLSVNGQRLLLARP